MDSVHGNFAQEKTKKARPESDAPVHLWTANSGHAPGDPMSILLENVSSPFDVRFPANQCISMT